MLLDRRNVQLGVTPMGVREFLPQQTGWDCFPIAVANCLIYLNHLGANLNHARKVAQCEGVGTLHQSDVVQFMQAPLIETWNAWDVVAVGGIVHIKPQRWSQNGHAVFVYPQDNFQSFQFTLVNSLLGPTTMPNWTMAELTGYLRADFGPFWVIDTNNIHRREYVV